MKQTSKKQNDGIASKTALPGQPVSTLVISDSGLPELFTDGIKDMYWSENHLVKSLPKMMNAAGKPALKKALANHLELTKEHAARLESVFELLGTKVQAKKCDACEGLVMSGEHIIENTVAGTEARDTGIIMAALKVENFEITSYNGLIQVATTLGLTDAVTLLNKNLADEIEADQLLTTMSQENNPSDAKATAKKTS